MRGDGGVAGKGRVVGVPKFHSWGKCTMTLTNINSDWMSNASSGLCIILVILVTLVTSKVTAPQDVHKKLVLQVYLGSNTLEFNRQRIPATLNDGTVTVESATSKANLLASHFSACFSQFSHNNCQCSSLSSMAREHGLSSVTCTTDEVHKLLCS